MKFGLSFQPPTCLGSPRDLSSKACRNSVCKISSPKTSLLFSNLSWNGSDIGVAIFCGKTAGVLLLTFSDSKFRTIFVFTGIKIIKDVPTSSDYICFLETIAFSFQPKTKTKRHWSNKFPLLYKGRSWWRDTSSKTAQGRVKTTERLVKPCHHFCAKAVDLRPGSAALSTLPLITSMNQSAGFLTSSGHFETVWMGITGKNAVCV